MAKIVSMEFDKVGIMAVIEDGEKVYSQGISYKAFKTKNEYLQKLKDAIKPKPQPSQAVKNEIKALEGATLNI